MGKRIKITAFLILTLVVLLQVKQASAQQDPMYTQYMDNLQVLNPGYAGSQGIGNILMVARSQWVEFDGAPATRSFTYNTSYDEQNVGVGFSLMSDQIGPLKQTGFYADYSYFIPVSEKFKLGLGLKGGVSFYRANLVALQTVDSDPVFNHDIYENFLPNVGVGLFLFSETTYFGVSVPKLIDNIIINEEVQTDYINKQQRHMYFVAGHRFDISEDFQLKTNGMMRKVKSAPLSVDMTVMGGFRDKFWVGAMYRFGDAYGMLVKFNPSPKMSIGYAYDITISELSAFNSGTHEIMFSYNLDLFGRVGQATAEK
ncbi:type IX secretion system membrane protein, PorP/SprF family [Draconibacterium orientale]|uniref:Membrane protein n=1 Tax=Draconibacterium orientale TaxID=1168034 RepID=X5DF01_9BACT|nr:type IX secretion system membrane protein PorP/SprF [Draconibacterium orientale]AHW59614.1 membrane protein [Draconibacterium orientale]SES82472.1 type IX secretion system membrane protein, PorP/SprF family [Draconibacterium orientale]